MKRTILVCLLSIAPIAFGAQRDRQLYYNQDDTDFFWSSQISEGKAGETLDRFVDGIAMPG